MSHSNLLYLALGVFAISSRSVGQTPPPASSSAPAVTLEELVNRAIRNSLQVKKNAILQFQAHENVEIAKTAYDLNLAGTGRWRQNIGSVLESDTGFSGLGEIGLIGVSSAFNIDDGGVRAANKQIAKLGLGSTEFTIKKANLDLAIAIVGAYYDLAASQRRRRAAIESIKALKANLKVVQDQFKVGNAVKSDVALAESAVDGAVSTQQAADLAIQTSQITLAQLLNEDGETFKPVAIEETLPPKVDSSLTPAAVLNHDPSLALAKINEAIQVEQAKVVHSARIPTVSLGAATGFVSLEDPFNTAGRNVGFQPFGNISISVNLPIFNNGAKEQDKLSQSNIRLAQVQTQQLQSMVRQEALLSLAKLKSVDPSIASAHALIEADTDLLATAQHRYLVGLGPEQDVINAYSALYAAQTVLGNLIDGAHLIFRSLKYQVSTLASN